MSFKITQKNDRQEHKNEPTFKKKQQQIVHNSTQVTSIGFKEYDFTLIGLDQQYQCLQGAAECLSLYGWSCQFILEGVSGSGKHILLKKAFIPFQESVGIVYVDAMMQNTQEIINEIVEASNKWKAKMNVSKRSKTVKQIQDSSTSSKKHNSSNTKSANILSLSNSNSNSETTQEAVAASELYGRHWALSGALNQAKMILVVFSYEQLSSELLYALSDRQHTCSSLLLVLATCKYCQETYLGLRVRSRLTAEKILMYRDIPPDQVAFQITLQYLGSLRLAAGQKSLSDVEIPQNMKELIQNRIKHNLLIQSGFHFVRNLALEVFIQDQKGGLSAQYTQTSNYDFSNLLARPACRNVDDTVLNLLNRRFHFTRLSKECLWLLSFCYLSQEKSKKAVKALIADAPTNLLTEQQKFILINCFAELRLSGLITFYKNDRFRLNCQRQTILSAISSNDVKRLFIVNKPAGK